MVRCCDGQPDLRRCWIFVQAGEVLDRDADTLCVPAEDVVTGERLLIPAETVFHPLPPELERGPALARAAMAWASGNSVLEATVHALAEVIRARRHQLSQTPAMPHAL